LGGGEEILLASRIVFLLPAGIRDPNRLLMEWRLKWKPLEISPSRNFISVSCLANCGFECHFGTEKCLIKFNNKCVGLAFRQDKLYKLYMHDEINVCDENVCETPNVPSSTKEKASKTELIANLRNCGIVV
jgi:hypothetical protein